MTFLQRVVVVLFTVFALCIAALAIAQQPPPPAPAAPKPLYPVDAKSGLADFNATCLYCRGFAQELRMYQDALIALRAEFAKRTAAMRAMTDAGLAGTLTPEQREQWKRDGEAAEKLETAIKDMEAAEARAKATLEACILKYCPPPPAGGTLLGPGKLIEPPQGQDVPYPATPFPSDKPLEPPRGQLPGSGQPPAPLQQQPGPQQPPAPPKPAEPKPGEGGLMGPTYLVEPDGSRTYLPPPGPPAQWPGIRAECPACNEAEAAVRAAFERRDAAQRKVDDLIRQRGKVVDEYLANILTSSEQQRRMAPITQALAAAQKELQDRSIEITSYLYNLDQCNKERCRGPASEDPARRLLLPGAGPQGPVKPVVPGGAAPGGGTPPAGGPGTAPPSGGPGTAPPSPPPGSTPPAPPPREPGTPGTKPGAPTSLPCDCDRHLREAAYKDQQARGFEADQEKARLKQQTSLKEQRAVITSLRQANPGMSPQAILDHPDVRRLESAMKMAESDESSRRTDAERARREAEAARGEYLKCKDACAAGPGPVGVMPGSPGAPGGKAPSTPATPAQSCDCEALLREAAKADAAAREAEAKVAETDAKFDQAMREIRELVAVLKGVNPDLTTTRDHPAAQAAQAKVDKLRELFDIQIEARDEAKATADRLRAEYEECKKRCSGAPATPPIGVLTPGTPAGGIDAPIDTIPAADFPFAGPEGPALPPTPQGPLSPAPGTPVTPLGGPCGCDGLLKSSDEAALKSANATYRADLAVEEMMAASARYEAGVKNPAIPPATVLQDHADFKAWQNEVGRLNDEAGEQDRLAKAYKSQYDECMKRCTAPEPPRLIVVINIGGNYPFGPNPMGGGLVITPPGNPGAAGSLQFSSPNYGGAEGGAVLITVVRTGGRRGPASVSYQTAGGNATAGADYQPVSGTLTWADGDDSPKSFSIALTDDGQVEPVETFNVSLSVFTGASPGSPLVAAVSIADKDSTSPAPAGSLQFSSSTYPTAEGAGAVTITVLRVNGNNGAVSVQYFTGPSSATAGSDYQAVNGTLQWPNGDVGGRTFTVPIIDDTLTEQTETFFVTLNNPTGGATLGVPATATVSITDNDLSTPVGPCGALGNAWQPNAGGPYTCSGSCQPIPSSPFVTVNGDIVTINPFHAGGAATFQGCGMAINSQSNNMIFFGQGGHSATVTREGDSSYVTVVRHNSGASCDFRCAGKPPPVR